MVQAITEFNPEYIKNSQYKPVQFSGSNEPNESSVLKNNFTNKIKNDVDRFDIVAGNKTNLSPLSARNFVKTTENPFVNELNTEKDTEKFISNTQGKSGVQQAALYALSPIPTIRRIGSLPETLKQNDLARAGLLTGMAAVCFPRDWEELRQAALEIKGDAPKGKLLSTIVPNVKNSFHNPINKYQRPLKFFDNTFLDWLPQKFEWLKKIDKTLDETKFGESIMKHSKISKPELEFLEGIGHKGTTVQAYSFTGGRFQQLIGRTLKRTPIIGIFIGCLLELPAILRSVKKGKNTEEKGTALFKQLCKSAVYVGLMTAGIGLAGAAAAKKGGTLLSLAGMGVGSSLAIAASNKINKFIDNKNA